jgi:Concanavalin A-like lectin/glucanases superfamily
MSGSQGFGGGFSRGLGNDGFGSGFTASPMSIVTDGLVLHYDVGDPGSYPGSGNTVYDLYGNSDATLYNGPTYGDGHLTFDGTNDALITNVSLAAKVPGDVTTIMMWAYPKDNGVLLSELGQQSLPNAGGWHDTQMEMVGGTMKFGMWNGTSISTIISSISTPLNAWYHFATVYDGTKLVAYVNGSPAGSATFSRLNPIENGNGLHYSIGAENITNMGDGTYASMRLGQFLVYSTPLSAVEVERNFRADRSRYGV